MILYEGCHWAFLRSLIAVCVSPTNTNNKFSVASTRDTNSVSAVKVIEPGSTTSVILPLSPFLYLMEGESVFA